ncbi:BZ3501_MvSof-1269-A2-R1_C65g00369 [Microbotryum saponariae]|nr:BZ3501_MvSof-1269-A2-R1_C65g00369 [Microbotryum saponariae]
MHRVVAAASNGATSPSSLLVALAVPIPASSVWIDRACGAIAGLGSDIFINIFLARHSITRSLSSAAARPESPSSIFVANLFMEPCGSIELVVGDPESPGTGRWLQATRTFQSVPSVRTSQHRRSSTQASIPSKPASDRLIDLHNFFASRGRHSYQDSFYDPSRARRCFDDGYPRSNLLDH